MTLSHGDYTRLARDYANHRPGYAPGVVAVLIERTARGRAELRDRGPDYVDVGAGTGIWTRMLAARARHAIAVEPNDAMRKEGQRASRGSAISWRAGSAEDTGLETDSCDLLTMASSFHWTDFERATAEFARVVRPGGLFAALWNTRDLERDPLLAEIEAELGRRVPHLARVSSGRSAFCEGLTERLSACGRFDEVGYLEDRHVERMTPERYLGIWRSVNDVRVQAGERVFAEFLAWVETKIHEREHIDATYLTRVWTARLLGAPD
jgi:SAM-dependent methyltransferase